MNRQRRVLVTLTPYTLAAVQRFRRSEEMTVERCPHCGGEIGRRTAEPSETTTLRRLVEIGLDYNERRLRP